MDSKNDAKLEDLVQDVREFSRLIVRELGMINGQIENTNMTHSECHVLLELEKNGILLARELAQIISLNKSTISRVVTSLIKKGWIKPKPSAQDARKKFLRLTPSGRKALANVHLQSNSRVKSALQELEPEGQKLIAEGLKSYACALRKSRLKSQLKIREVKSKDNLELSSVILQVLKSFVGEKEGFATRDKELLDMFKYYSQKGRKFFVATDGDRVLGGAGISQLEGGDLKTCELRKMYLLPEAQGLGIGRKLIETCLSFARKFGYKKCYLETLHCMGSANALYDKFNFRDLKRPLGSTGHHGCDRWRIREL